VVTAKSGDCQFAIDNYQFAIALFGRAANAALQ
jgi:hypothetical protein